MSDLRPRRTGRSWSLHTDQTGNPSAVDTFTVLATPTITGVTNGGSSLNIAINDTNGAADLTFYTYNVQRSVDGSPFYSIGSYQAGGILASLIDFPIIYIGDATLDDGTVVTFPSASPFAYVSILESSPSTNAYVLFDVVVLRADGHSQILPSGTHLTLATPANSGYATPKGHTYAYKVQALNKFQKTAFSASSSLTVNSTWSAQNITSTARVNNKVTVTWTDPNTYAAGNSIEVWKDVNGAGYALLATLVKAAPAMPTSYVDAFDFLTLVPATYSYKVRAASDIPQDIGPFSNAGSVVVNFTLNAVTAVTATPVGYTQINLAWTDSNAPANEAGVYVDRCATATGQFQRIATLAAGATNYSDVFVSEPGQTYGYRITPFNALHAGPPSTTALATTAMLTPSVSKLSQLADVGVRVSWTDPNLHATGYTIQRSINGGAFSTVGTVGQVNQFDDFVALSIGDTATYKIQAFNPYVTSPFSTTLAIVVGRILVAPTGVTPVIVRFGVVNITWTGLNSGNRGVYLYRSINGAATTLVATLPKDARSYTDLFQTIPGQVYAYQVQDFDNQEIGPLSDFGVVDSTLDGPVSLQIAGTTPPDFVTLQWTAFTLPQSTNEDYISIERAFGAGGFSEIGRVAFGQSPTFQARITGGVPGDAVMFRVRKVKQPYFIFGTVQVPENLGDYSQTVSTVSPLSVPTGVTITRNAAGVNNVAWTDTNTLATGFKIFRQTTISGVASPLVQIATINNPAARSYNDTVDSGQNYIFTYSVLAFNATNSSIYSGYGTLTTRLPAVILELTQNGRVNLEIDFAIPFYFGVGSDKMQLFRTLNSGTPTVIATFNYPFFSGFLYNDTLAVGDTASYSARLFSPTELGPSSVPVSITMGDIIDTSLGNIKQIRIHGARNKFVQRDIFAVGLGGIAKVSFDPVTTDPIVAYNLAAGVTNAYSGISGDQTRLVVFTNATPGAGSAVLVDASTLAIVSPVADTITDTYTYSGGAAVFGQAKLDYYANVESGNYLDGASGVYQGWGLVNFTALQNMNPNFPLRLVPWTNTLGAVNLSSFYTSGATSGQTTVATPFSLGSFLPLRLENLNGDCAFCINTGGNFSTFYRAQRSGNSYVKLVDIPARVMDFVSDGVSKIVAVTVRGEIYLIDMQFNPSNPSFQIIGQVPGVPINADGALIDITQDFMSIELMASKKIAVAVGGHTSQRRMAGGFQSQSFIYVFDVPGILTTNGSLTLASTIASIEKITSLAFDGKTYIYGTSNDNIVRLLRFNAGF